MVPQVPAPFSRRFSTPDKRNHEGHKESEGHEEDLNAFLHALHALHVCFSSHALFVTCAFRRCGCALFQALQRGPIRNRASSTLHRSTGPPAVLRPDERAGDTAVDLLGQSTRHPARFAPETRAHRRRRRHATDPLRCPRIPPPAAWTRTRVLESAGDTSDPQFHVCATSSGTSPRTTTSDDGKAAAGLSTRNASRSDRVLVGREVDHAVGDDDVHGVSGRGMASIVPLRNSTFVAPAFR